MKSPEEKLANRVKSLLAMMGCSEAGTPAQPGKASRLAAG